MSLKIMLIYIYKIIKYLNWANKMVFLVLVLAFESTGQHKQSLVLSDGAISQYTLRVSDVKKYTTLTDVTSCCGGSSYRDTPDLIATGRVSSPFSIVSLS